MAAFVTVTPARLTMPPRVLTALPVFNEQSHLVAVLPEVRRFSQDVLVVDDGSTDRTPLLLAEMDGIEVLRHPVNQGYGAGLRTAFEHAIDRGYDALVTIDCDGQHQPRLIPELAAALWPAECEPYDIVSGSRYLEELVGDNAAPEDRRRINQRITRQLNDCFDLGLTDAFCGFKAYRCEALAALDIAETGYAMPLEVWVQASRANLSIIELPVPLIYLDETR